MKGIMRFRRNWLLIRRRRVFRLVLTVRRNSEAVFHAAAGAFAHASGQRLSAAIDPRFPL